MLIPKEGVDSSSGMLLSWMYIVFSRDSALVLCEYSTLSTVDFNFFFNPTKGCAMKPENRLAVI